MSITYTWTIARLDTAPSVGELADVVTCVHWRLAGEDGAHRAEIYGSIGLVGPDAPAPESGTFTAFEDLTEAQVLDWLAGAMDTAAVEAGVAAMIADQQAPALMARPAPWE